MIEVRLRSFFKRTLENEVNKLISHLEDAGYYAKEIKFSRDVFYHAVVITFTIGE